jgi:hypothetical protein
MLMDTTHALAGRKNNRKHLGNIELPSRMAQLTLSGKCEFEMASLCSWLSCQRYELAQV